MIQKIAEGIYRVIVPMVDNPLRFLNSYILPGEERSLVIDTGFRRPDCRAVLEEAFAELQLVPEKTDFYITHYHADHMGLAGDLATPESTIYLGEADYTTWKASRTPEGRAARRAMLSAEGLPPELCEEFYLTDIFVDPGVDRPDRKLHLTHPGEILQYGGRSLKIIGVPGHTRGNSMLWSEQDGIMFTGDHVLFDVTPNIMTWWKDGDALGSYLNSLAEADSYPVQLALPAHRETGDYHARIASLIAHHQRRTDEVAALVAAAPGSCGYELAGRMHWRIRAAGWDDFPLTQKWFAMGECVAHLDHMVVQGSLLRKEENGLRRYYPAE